MENLSYVEILCCFYKDWSLVFLQIQVQTIPTWLFTSLPDSKRLILNMGTKFRFCLSKNTADFLKLILDLSNRAGPTKWIFIQSSRPFFCPPNRKVCTKETASLDAVHRILALLAELIWKYLHSCTFFTLTNQTPWNHIWDLKLCLLV